MALNLPMAISPLAVFAATSSPVKLEDVFKSTHETMNAPVSAFTVLALAMVALALGLLLLVLHYRRRQQAIPKAINHHGKLLKEVARKTGLKSSDLKQLHPLADEQSLASPLVLLLCPSILSKAAQNKTPEQRKALSVVVKRLNPGPE